MNLNPQQLQYVTDLVKREHAHEVKLGEDMLRARDGTRHEIPMAEYNRLYHATMARAAELAVIVDRLTEEA